MASLLHARGDSDDLQGSIEEIILDHDRHIQALHRSPLCSWMGDGRTIERFERCFFGASNRDNTNTDHSPILTDLENVVFEQISWRATHFGHDGAPFHDVQWYQSLHATHPRSMRAFERRYVTPTRIADMLSDAETEYNSD